jgi:ADP-ribosyl-[dinitrogen reductase] hydrolase
VSDEQVRLRCLRRLEMVETLHRRGFQRLRITPAIAPSGLHWRLSVHAPGCEDVDRWTSGNPDDGLDAEQLADRFVTEHPALAAAGRADDPAYAAWLGRAVHVARSGWLPYFFADWPTDDVDGVPLSGPEEDRPRLEEPPGGR